MVIFVTLKYFPVLLRDITQKYLAGDSLLLLFWPWRIQNSVLCDAASGVWRNALQLMVDGSPSDQCSTLPTQSCYYQILNHSTELETKFQTG